MDATDRRKRASDEATEWLIVLQGDAGHAQREQFIDWLRESPIHVAEMLRVAQVHGALEQFNRWAHIPTDGSSDDDDMVVALPTARSLQSEPESHRQSSRTLKLASSLAAMFVVAAVALAMLFPHWRGQVIQTDRAERREVALADGSVVQVDPETRLRIRYEQRARYVFLERGRALFHVAKNKDRPFLVQAQDTTVRAVGTAFAVEQQSNAVLVTVAEGKVEVIPSTAQRDDSKDTSGSTLNVSPNERSLGAESQQSNHERVRPRAAEAASTETSRDSSRQIYLVANQQVAVDRSGSAETVRTIDSGRALAWAEGRLVFEDVTVGDAIGQFNKYNSIQIVVSNASLVERPISGVFNASDPESFVAFIQSVTSVRVTRKNGSDIAIDPINLFYRAQEPRTRRRKAALVVLSRPAEHQGRNIFVKEGSNLPTRTILSWPRDTSLTRAGRLIVKVVLLSVVFCIAGLGAPVAAQAIARSYQLNIPKQPLDAALKDLAQQTGFQIGRLPDKRGAAPVVGPVNGEMSVESALHSLLAPTKFTYKLVNDSTIAVLATDSLPAIASTSASQSADPANSGPRDQKEGKNNSSRDFRLVQVGQGTTQAASSVSPAVTPSSDIPLEEILVTAQKREERLQDVPVPVTTLSGDALVSSNQVRIEDYFSSVPGLSVSPGDEHGAPQLAIRGITTGGFTTPTVGIVIDDVPFGGAGINYGFEAPDIDPSDLARVEVLRGPQGTLYGDSSMGGLLKYVTIDPSTDELSGRLMAGTSTVQNGNQLGYNVRGSVNVPVTDEFALRASAFSRLDPGYIDNIVDGERAVNRGDAYGGRLATLWRPSEAVTLKLSALFQNSRVVGSPDITVGPGLGDLQQADIPGTGWRQDKIQAYSANLNAKFAGLDLTSITGYSINTISDSYDFQSPYYSSVAVSSFGVSGTPLPEDVKTSQFTQEIRLSGSIGARIDWLVGAFYDHVNSKLIETVLAANPTTGQIVGDLGSFLSTDPPSLFSEYALFTDWTWRLTDQFDVQVGGRESQDRTSPPPTIVTGILGTAFCGSLPCVFPAGSVTTDHSFTYLVTPRFKISQDLMVYARLASGYRPGGSNSQPTPLPVYKPDSTENYEIGIKGNALQHMLSFDASVYYIKWKDIQIQLRDPLTNDVYLGNGAGAKSQGVELSIEARPVTGLTVSAWTAWDDAVLTEATAYGAAGDRLPNSSRFSANLALRQEFPLTSTVTGFVSGSESYIGSRQGVFVSAPPRQNYPAYAKTDLQAGARCRSWTLTLFANNVMDRRGLLSGGIGSLNSNDFYVIQPRTIGLSLSKTF